LIRAKGGASMVAMGFSIGIAVEMFNLPTYGTSFLLIFPLIYWLRGNLSSALIGFGLGKLLYLLGLGAVNAYIGDLVLPHFSVHFSFLPHWVNKLLLFNVHLLVGGIIMGILLGIILFFPIRFFLEKFKTKRREKRKLRNAIRLDTRTPVD
jgi:uncharacterized protein (DUF2062 family)